MRIVQGDEVQGAAASKHRGGSATYARLLDGDDSSLIDNFSLILAKTPGRFSPRHRHNFEQFRFQLRGTADYGRTGKLKPGMLGYFPEAVHYGPQTQDEGDELEMLVLQCGGASGSGYPGRNASAAATEELKKLGEFKDGVFHRSEGVPGKRNVDGFQAIWEHVNQRPLVYPKPRYDAPILTYPENFDWVPLSSAEGVWERRIGAFTERQCEASFLRLDEAAEFALLGKRDIFVVLQGSGTIGDQPLRRLTTVYLDVDEEAHLVGRERLEILHFRLPDLSQLKADAGTPSHAQAAE
jgi:hypothetical protein